MGPDDILAREVEDDVDGLSSRHEMHGAPIDRDLAAADAQEPSKIDDRCANPTVSIDDYIDDLAHLLARAAQRLLAQDALHILAVEDDRRGLGSLLGWRNQRQGRLQGLRLGRLGGASIAAAPRPAGRLSPAEEPLEMAESLARFATAFPKPQAP